MRDNQRYLPRDSFPSELAYDSGPALGLVEEEADKEVQKREAAEAYREFMQIVKQPFMDSF